SIIFTALALFTWCLYKLTDTNTRKRILLLIFCSLILLFIRSHVFAVLVPASIAYFLATERNLRFAFLKTYSIAGAILLVLSFVPQLNPVGIMANKQKDFFDLPVASSQVAKDTLQPTAISL